MKACRFFQLGKNQGLSRERVFALTNEWIQKIDTHIDTMERLWGVYEQTNLLPPHTHRFGWEDATCRMKEGV